MGTRERKRGEDVYVDDLGRDEERRSALGESFKEVSLFRGKDRERFMK